MDLVKSPNKSLSVRAVLQEFKQRSIQLSALDKAELDSSKVLLFLKAYVGIATSVVNGTMSRLLLQ